MHISEFDVYKDLLKEKSGLSLTPDKSYLLDSRLTPVAKKWEFENLSAMTKALQGVPNPDLVKDVIEAMTTNETSFFRDSRPFDIFRDVVLPHFVAKRTAIKKLRIWCAASSTGQEPYSLAMIIKEQQAKLNGLRFEIVATDISSEVLETAKKGIYSQFEVQRGLPIQMLMKYFTQVDDKWAISDEIKSMVQYKYFNLLDSYGSLGSFDIVFCRNVLIYFDKQTKIDVLEKIAKMMPPDGYLMLGGAETVIGFTERFQAEDGQRGLYLLAGAGEKDAKEGRALAR